MSPSGSVRNCEPDGGPVRSPWSWNPYCLVTPWPPRRRGTAHPSRVACAAVPCGAHSYVQCPIRGNDRRLCCWCCSSYPALSTYNVCCKTCCHVTRAAASRISCFPLLIAPFPPVLDLTPCCFVSRGRSKGTVPVESTVVVGNEQGLHTHSPLTP